MASKINPQTGCLEWKRGCAHFGYGAIWFDGKGHLAHRVSYEIFVGPIPEGMFILHHCDNPSCINPEHLHLGTAKDNAADALARNRFVVGERNGKAILTQKVADEIRSVYNSGQFTQHQLANKYNVSRSTIRNVVNLYCWKSQSGPMCVNKL